VFIDLSAYICLAILPVLVDLYVAAQGNGREVGVGVALISPEYVKLAMLARPAAAEGEVFVGDCSHKA
jgi:hypothetical protein